jgi:hypothetical protein
MSVSNIEHAIPLANGVRAIARPEGIKVRQDMSGFTDEVVCVIRWKQIDHLRARMLDQR